MSRDDWDLVMAVAVFKDYKVGETIIEEGIEGPVKLYQINTGRVVITKKNGEETIQLGYSLSLPDNNPVDPWRGDKSWESCPSWRLPQHLQPHPRPRLLLTQWAQVYQSYLPISSTCSSYYIPILRAISTGIQRQTLPNHLLVT